MPAQSTLSPSAHPLPLVVGQRRLPLLNGLRAMGVLMVMVGHANLLRPIYGLEFYHGDVPVEGFLVLSGFLITLWLLQEYDSTNGISLKHFYTRRALRLWPAYFVFLLVAFLAQDFQRPGGRPWTPGVIWSAVSFVPNYYRAFMPKWDHGIVHLWSIGLEEQFYLVWPVALIALLRRGRDVLRKGLIAAIAAAFAWRMLLWTVGVSEDYLAAAFETRCDALAMGCLLAVWSTDPSSAQSAARLARRPWWPMITIALLAITLTWPDAYQVTVGITVQIILLAVVIAQLLMLHDHPLWRWLDHPVLSYLGLISYPMYLYHHLGAAFGRQMMPGSPRWIFMIEVVATIVMGSMSYYFVERPFLRLKHRFASIRGRPVVPVPSRLAA